MINFKKIIIFVVIAFFSISQSFAKMEDSIYATVANKAITHSDIIKEIKIILILNGQTFSEDQRVSLEKAAIKSVVKRQIKKIEIEKYDDLKFNPEDLDKELNRLAKNLNIDMPTLKDAFIANDIDFSNVVEQMKTELLWNTLIFEIYKNRLTINKDEIQEQLEKIDSNVEIEEYLLSEIVIPPVPKDMLGTEIKNIQNRIAKEGFTAVALSSSITETSFKGGDLGWISENIVSEQMKSKIKSTPIGEVAEPILLAEGILFIHVRDKKVSKKSTNLEKAKNQLVNIEKSKILNMYSLSHYDNLRRSTAIKYY